MNVDDDAEGVEDAGWAEPGRVAPLDASDDVLDDRGVRVGVGQLDDALALRGVRRRRSQRRRERRPLSPGETAAQSPRRPRAARCRFCRSLAGRRGLAGCHPVTCRGSSLEEPGRCSRGVG